ncbi:MAG: YbdK family carboxylate-amine ligase [Mariprofundaceae bacterium]
MHSRDSVSFPFKNSQAGTLGVEMEWMTVNQQTGEQAPAAPQLLQSIPPTDRIKHELFTSTIEINTAIHTSTSMAVKELSQLYHQVSDQLQQQGAALFASGTHPVSRWRDQEISDDPRYTRLFERLQRMAHRFNIFGIHVHIGMPDGNQCIHCMNQLLPITPIFLAISSNSPFWQSEDTGLAASRIKIFEGLSQAGMPFYFNDWNDFEHCSSRLLATDSIDSIRDIWWEMRPHPDFGTLEIRIGDMPVDKASATAYIAYVKAEACMALSQPKKPKVHPSLIRENRWRACRYGMHAIMIDPDTEQLQPLLHWLEKRLDLLAQFNTDPQDLSFIAKQIKVWRKLGGGADQQRRLYQKHRDFRPMLHEMRQTDGWTP